MGTGHAVSFNVPLSISHLRIIHLMLRKNRLFTPGPTPLLPSAQNAMAAFGMHHRTADFRTLYTRTLADLKAFIGTNNDCLLLASSGSGAMEASISNLTSPGDTILVLTAGKFGERWADLGKAYGCKVEIVKAEYGQTFPLEAVRQKLSADVRVVYMQATESSTGVRHDVPGVAKLLRDAKHEALLVVDAITGLGTTKFDVDGWGLDIVIGGSQKAVMIPPGLAYLSVSERAWQRMETTKSPRYYFDLRKERKAASKGESAFTPATSLIAGLGAAFAGQYEEGDVLRYSKGSKQLDIEPGEYTRVEHVDRKQNQITVERENGEEVSYDPRRLQGVTLYRETERSFAEGDRVQFTAPSKELHVANRELGNIERITDE